MSKHFKPAVLAAILTTSALAVLAQPAGSPPPEGGPGMQQSESEHRAHRQERMKAHMAQRAAELKADLKLTPEQESGWNAYLAAMKPPAPAARPQRDDIAKLSTPERLDKMREMRQQREAEFDKRDAATRSFYASLSAEQKKTFDARTARPMHEEGRRHHGPR
ncbi:MAG: Spy/CpxP family protein refolding chaperone [Hylemonella sp.]|uniref:Spy/CpxP family protein refolding chaperone n=1 Tax=Hylemonella sp. TaxID=2066020 RepID=UPI0022C2522E|nr:Spy/CpxP family protein refolding chaperone [Hylemonella sp.]MCZ8252848.1 Spy/CpxP family protein refolding chaperone [Hylemonella sp.]